MPAHLSPQFTRRWLHLSRSKVLKSDCTVKSTWLMGFHGWWKLRVRYQNASTSAGKTQSDSGARRAQQTFWNTFNASECNGTVIHDDHKWEFTPISHSLKNQREKHGSSCYNALLCRETFHPDIHLDATLTRTIHLIADQVHPLIMDWICMALFKTLTNSRFHSFTHSHTYWWWWTTIVATAALGQTDRSVAAIQRLQPLRPPPQTYSSHTHSHEARLMAVIPTAGWCILSH